MKLVIVACLSFLVAIASASDLQWDDYRPIEERFLKDPNKYALFIHYLNLFGSPSQDAYFGAQPSPRIVGGKIASPGQFPHQAALRIAANDGNYFCGGSIISAQYLLTAAHCSENAKSITVVLGAQNIRAKEKEQVVLVVPAANIKVHTGYNPSTIRNDISVLKLPKKVTFNNRIQPVQLPSKLDAQNSFAGVQATTSGWGKPRDSATSISEELRYVQTEIISQQSCKNIFYIIQASNICASGKGGKSSCSGDSGGPLTVGSGANIKQVGVVSFGSAFGCSIGFPHAYTRVTSYLDFIQANSDLTFN